MDLAPWPRSQTSAALRAGPEEATEFERDHALARVLAGIGGGPVPPVLGRYHVHGLMGAGAHGRVYDAWDGCLQRRVALKVITDPDHTVRGEAQALARLDTPGVVTIHELVEDDECTALVMKFVDGPTMQAWAVEHRPGWRRVLELMMHVAAALHAVHEAGLVHGDVKPSNVVVGDDGRPVLIDFSLAAPREQANGPAGTPRYMAPEAHAKGPTARSDQYSFFATLCSLLGAESTGEIQPRALAAVVTRGLAEDPQRRFESMAAVGKSLRSLLTRRRRAVGVGVVVAVVACGLGLGSARRVHCQRLAAVPVAAPLTTEALPDGVDSRPLAAALEDAASTWSAAVRAQCESSSLSMPWPEVTTCLESQRRRLALATAIARDRPATAVAHVDAVVALLPDPTQCEADPDLVAQGWAAELPPAAFLDLREQLDHAELMMDIDPDVARRQLDAIASTSLPTCTWAPDVALLRARQQYDGGGTDDAIVTLVQAAAQAEACERLSAQLAARTEVVTLLTMAGRNREAHDWLRLGEATLSAHPALERSDGWRISMARAWLAYAELRIPDARRSFAAAEADLQAQGKPADEATHKHIGMAGLLLDPGASAMAQTFIDEQSARWGPGHPNVAKAFSLLGRVHAFAGELEAAASAHREALAIFERWGSAFATDLHIERFFLGTAVQVSAPQEAIDQLLSYVDFMRAENPSSPTRGEAWSVIASARLNLGRFSDARDAATQAVEILGELAGPDSPLTLQARAMQGGFVARDGDPLRGTTIACKAAEVVVGGKSRATALAPSVLNTCLQVAALAPSDRIAELLAQPWVTAAIETCADGPVCEQARDSLADLRARVDGA